MRKEYLELGRIVGTHGVRGEMKLELWCDGPEFVSQFHTVYLDENGEQPLALLSARAHKNQSLLTVRGYDSIEKAETLRNRVLYIRRTDRLPRLRRRHARKVLRGDHGRLQYRRERHLGDS